MIQKVYDIVRYVVWFIFSKKHHLMNSIPGGDSTAGMSGVINEAYWSPSTILCLARRDARVDGDGAKVLAQISAAAERLSPRVEVFSLHIVQAEILHHRSKHPLTTQSARADGI